LSFGTFLGTNLFLSSYSKQKKQAVKIEIKFKNTHRIFPRRPTKEKLLSHQATFSSKISMKNELLFE
jgi:hypothetical protein